jgi:hypothetical protein
MDWRIDMLWVVMCILSVDGTKVFRDFESEQPAYDYIKEEYDGQECDSPRYMRIEEYHQLRDSILDTQVLVNPPQSLEPEKKEE